MVPRFAVSISCSNRFRELQRSEQHLQEENDRLAAAASKSALKIRSLKQDRDELKGVRTLPFELRKYFLVCMPEA